MIDWLEEMGWDLGAFWEGGQVIYCLSVSQEWTWVDHHIFCLIVRLIQELGVKLAVFRDGEALPRPFLRILDVYPGSEFCPSRMPDPGSKRFRIRIKEFYVLLTQKLFLISRKYDPECSSRSRIFIFWASRIQGSKRIPYLGSRRRIRNTSPDPSFLIVDWPIYWRWASDGLCLQGMRRDDVLPPVLWIRIRSDPKLFPDSDPEKNFWDPGSPLRKVTNS